MNGTKLRELRESLGLTRLQVAYATGTTPSTIYNIETGKTNNPGIEMVKALAKLYQVPIEDLLN